MPACADVQLPLFEEDPVAAVTPGPEEEPDLDSYDYIIVAYSGGKDSTAMVLDLLERGVPKGKIELWHHDVDGREGEGLMDWPCTPAYCRAFAKALGLDLYFSWKEGGIEREMLRDGDRTAPNHFETPRGEIGSAGGGGEPNTRLKFPQVSVSPQTRWCTAYAKIMVADAALINQKRFRECRTLFLTGERAEESASRAKYKPFEPHRADLRDGKRYRRHIDHWRPIHDWPENKVWDIIRRWRINPHISYRLNFSRCSCMWCIFGNDAQFSSAAKIAPERAEKIIAYEEEFGYTIKRDRSVRQMLESGTPYEMDPADMEAAMSETWDEPIILDEGKWELPSGAYGDSCGPT